MWEGPIRKRVRGETCRKCLGVRQIRGRSFLRGSSTSRSEAFCRLVGAFLRAARQAFASLLGGSTGGSTSQLGPTQRLGPRPESLPSRYKHPRGRRAPDETRTNDGFHLQRSGDPSGGDFRPALIRCPRASASKSVSDPAPPRAGIRINTFAIIPSARSLRCPEPSPPPCRGGRLGRQERELGSRPRSRPPPRSKPHQGEKEGQGVEGWRHRHRQTGAALPEAGASARTRQPWLPAPCWAPSHPSSAPARPSRSFGEGGCTETGPKGHRSPVTPVLS